MNPVVLICTHERVEITTYNIESLLRQTLVPEIVLVVSEQREYKLYREKFPSIYVVRYPNKPLGKKWDAGVHTAYTINANPLIILGSDDILGPNYVETCTKLTAEGHDFIGLKKWFIHHKGKAYLCQYMANMPLGGARCYSAHLLAALNWQIFDVTKNRHLDDFGYYKILKHKFKPTIIECDFHAVKGDWKVMNEFNLNHPNIELISTHDSETLLPNLPSRRHSIANRRRNDDAYQSR